MIGCLVAQQAFRNEALSTRSTPNSLTAPFCAIRSDLVPAVKHVIHCSQHHRTRRRPYRLLRIVRYR